MDPYSNPKRSIIKYIIIIYITNYVTMYAIVNDKIYYNTSIS